MADQTGRTFENLIREVPLLVVSSSPFHLIPINLDFTARRARRDSYAHIISGSIPFYPRMGVFLANSIDTMKYQQVGNTINISSLKDTLLSDKLFSTSNIAHPWRSHHIVHPSY